MNSCALGGSAVAGFELPDVKGNLAERLALSMSELSEEEVEESDCTSSL